MKSICVFCGSSTGGDPVYANAAADLGRQLAHRNIDLVYGGGHVGLMGILADAVLDAGGRVTGVIPKALMDREVGHRSLSELHVVDTMHQRKAMMAEKSDAFLALPGGIGTLEELFEVWTWGQLGIHAKPCAILNINGFFNGLVAFIRHAVAEQFLRSQHFDMILIDAETPRLLDRMAAYQPPTVQKWLRRAET